jgi:hypothetical protein
MAIKKAKATISGSVLTIAFAHGEELTTDVNEFSNTIKAALLMHGAKQKLCDSYSGAETPEEALECAKAVLEGLMNDAWSTRGTGEGATRVTQLARALSMVTGKPLEEAIELVSEMATEKKKALSNNAQIKVAIAEIQAEKARQLAEQASAETEGLSIDDILNAEEEAPAA